MESSPPKIISGAAEGQECRSAGSSGREDWRILSCLQTFFKGARRPDARCPRHIGLFLTSGKPVDFVRHLETRGDSASRTLIWTDTEIGMHLAGSAASVGGWPTRK